VYVAIVTGFCGSLTTFSTFVVQVFLAYGDQAHLARNKLHNVMEALSLTSITFGMSLIALRAGRNLKKSFPLSLGSHPLGHRKCDGNLQIQDDWISEDASRTADEDARPPCTLTIDLTIFLLGLAFWIAAAIVCRIYAPFRHVTHALLFAPPGAILRWYLSRWNPFLRSERFPRWPVGTLTANLLATAIYCCALVLRYRGRCGAQNEGQQPYTSACSVLYGLQEGFASCLSTMSTFIVELDQIRPRRYAVGYAAISYVLGVCVCNLVIGASWWTIVLEGNPLLH
jgi:fluoride ion exporter CrcB/FEX